NYSSSIATDDVVITGIRVLEKTKDEENKDAIVTYQTGKDGYVVSIENNELIKGGTGQQIAGWLGQQLIGFRFRKAQITHSSDPTIEAGDVALWTDRKQNTYRIVISSTKFTTGGAQTTVSSAENPARNSATRYSAQTKNYVEYRKDIEKERTDREIALEQLKERVDNASGLFTTEVTQPDGSTIFYMHDKPTLEESMIVWVMTAEAWAVSTDGGKTYNAGLTVDGDLITRILTATGVNADWIKTGQIRVTKGDKTVFLVDIDTGEVIITPDYFELSGKTVEEIAQEKADKEVKDFVNSVYDPKIASLQSQIDGQIETWYYDHDPTLYISPASSWTTESERAKHEGDLFYWKSKGYSYRFFKDGSTWKWQLITDSDITTALATASEAQDTADSKRRVFLNTPTPPYDRGDLWFNSTTSDIMTCVTSRSSGSYVSSDWQKRNKYIDQSAADTAAKNAVDAQTQTDIFNKLTDNGARKGIYMQNGELYMNATYIKTGYISADRIQGGTLILGGVNNGNGVLSVKNASGTEIGRWDKDGIYVDGGNIYCKTSTTGASIYGGRMHLTYGDTNVGYIGTNHFESYTAYKGLVFDLEDTGAYMTWAAKASSSDTTYYVKLLYANKTVGAYTAGKLYAACNMDFMNYSIERAYIDGLRVKTSFQIPNNVDCNIYSHVNFHNYEIQDAKINNLVAINGTTPFTGQIKVLSSTGGAWGTFTVKDGIITSAADNIIYS
ncbi:MAG: hypothetical protein NC548_66235, partial [Lachnospiraceae bacterium]|nr:hypothetical protein [Lachnospiraceae bacterium]